MTQAYDATAYVDVRVPQELVGSVYALLGTLMSGPRQAPESEAHKPPPEATWSAELVARAYRESPHGSMKPIFRHLAEQPGEWVGSGELLELLGLADRSSLAGVFGAFGRRVKNRYSMESWPFEHRWNYEDGEQLYRMSERVADVIKREAQSDS